MNERMTIYTVTDSINDVVVYVFMTAIEAMNMANDLNSALPSAVYEYARVDLPVSELCNYIKIGMNHIN